MMSEREKVALYHGILMGFAVSDGDFKEIERCKAAPFLDEVSNLLTTELMRDEIMGEVEAALRRWLQHQN